MLALRFGIVIIKNKIKSFSYAFIVLRLLQNGHPKLNIDNVDQIIVVSDWVKDHCIKQYDWPNHKIAVIPQYIDCNYFERSKLKGAEFNLGFVGIVPFDFKRFDRALDVLEEVRKKDKRFSLHVRSKMPWEFDYLWKNENEREKYEETFKKLDSPLLRNAVVFDDPGSDMGSWFRKVNYILSTSECEGCHTAVCRGNGCWLLSCDFQLGWSI